MAAVVTDSAGLEVSSARRSGVPASAAIWLLVLASLLPGCGVTPERDGPPPFGSVDVSRVPDAVPRMEPKSRYGNPGSYVVAGKRYYTLADSRGFVERGIASWYGKKFHGRRTSSGETYNMYAMTAAHTRLPLPTYVRVRNLRNNRSVVVRVNDRGPFHSNRVIDVSYAAASRLGMLAKGTAFVEVRAIDPSAPPRVASAATVPALSRGASLYLQVGAFALRRNAERLKSRLGRMADTAVRISEVILQGTPIYRVQLGPLLDVAQADRLADLLAAAGYEAPHIVLD